MAPRQDEGVDESDTRTRLARGGESQGLASEPAASPGSSEAAAPGNDGVSDQATTAPASKSSDEVTATPSVRAPPPPPGFLVVEQARDDEGGPIRVSVDDRLRGRTPIRIELAPGEHDIAFSREGKRRFLKVVIESDEDTEIVATVPE